MNRDDVLRMARESDCLDPQHYGSMWVDKLERFAALVADATRGDYHEGFEEGYKAGAVLEREECAKLCDEKSDDLWKLFSGESHVVADKGQISSVLIYGEELAFDHLDAAIDAARAGEA